MSYRLRATTAVTGTVVIRYYRCYYPLCYCLLHKKKPRIYCAHVRARVCKVSARHSRTARARIVLLSARTGKRWYHVMCWWFLTPRRLALFRTAGKPKKTGNLDARCFMGDKQRRNTVAAARAQQSGRVYCRYAVAVFGGRKKIKNKYHTHTHTPDGPKRSPLPVTRVTSPRRGSTGKQIDKKKTEILVCLSVSYRRDRASSVSFIFLHIILSFFSGGVARVLFTSRSEPHG